MFGEEKNLKDSSNDLGITLKDRHIVLSYTKTNKLITALYMVTDILEKDEPLRNKLRTLGTNIISDINSIPFNACAKIAETVSFLDIASAINIISEMNCTILRKEFLELDQSIKQSSNKAEFLNTQISLSDFFTESPAEVPSRPRFEHIPSKGQYKSMGHKSPTRIGVQKGSTLLKALSDTKLHPSEHESFEVLKKQRREEILRVIKAIGSGATIKDIKDKVRQTPEQFGSLVSCGEKTLQRELGSMVKDDVLNKTGEKRWSNYSIKN